MELHNQLETQQMQQDQPSEIYWLNKDSRKFLAESYLRDGQTPEARIRQISEGAEKILKKKGFADKFESYMHKGWYSLATPVWANFANGRGLAISCNGSYISDKMSSILEKVAETGVLTKHGAGTSGYFGDLRGRGAKISTGGSSSGPVHFMELFDTVTRVVSQSNVRRGSYAAYLPIDHPDIMEFLGIKDKDHAIQDMSFGVCISDEWMKKMIARDKDCLKVWAKVIERKFDSGYPYIFFTDNVNNSAPDVYKDKKMKIHASNLCTEIMLSASETETFVCNLSSMNLLHFDDWKDTDAVETLTYFLDSVMEDYIQSTKGVLFLESAHNFAKNQRALGIGVLGWHSYLQSKMIAFESMEAKMLNTKIHRVIRDKSLQASKELAKEYGEPPLLKGYGRRNVTTMAIAPTTSSSFILGQVSPSIEPLLSNYFSKDLDQGKFTHKNPYFKTLLKTLGKDTKEVWDSILTHGGSVQHLKFLTEDQKNVFKTFGEISQKEIVIQAAARQKFIDQGQSINFRISPKTPAKDVNALIIFAWEQGIKSLYYQRSANPAQQLARDILHCSACEA